MVRIGIIGLGVHGRGVIANGFLSGRIEGAKLHAACDTNPAKLAWLKEKHPEVKTFDSPEALLACTDVNAVVVATPHYDHPVLAIAALERDKHVLIEKPAGVYTKNVRELNERAAKSDKIFAIMFNQRTNPMFQKMREMVQGGELGNLKRFLLQITDWYRPQAYYDSGGWRATWKGEGGGVLINQCPHNLDLWQWILGMPKRITAFVHEGKWHDIEVEDDVSAYAEYENGATGIFVTSTGDAPGTNRFEILGDMGRLIFENGKLLYTKLLVSEREHNKTTKEMFSAPKSETLLLECPGDYPQHEGVLRDFVRAVKGEGELVARGEEGINGLMLSNAIHLSGWLGKTVELPVDEDLFLSELKKRWK